MKRFVLFMLVCLLTLAACTSQAQEPAGAVLKVSDGITSKSYTADDLKSLGEEQATIKGVAYVGVPLTVLLKDAGIDPTVLAAVKAVAADGFAANYDATLFGRQDTLVAFARVDGPLAEDEGPFRMVLPDQEGKLNPRQLVEIIAIP